MKKLNRETLENWKIRVITDNDGNHHIIRTTYLYGKYQDIELKPQKHIKRFKNGNETVYYIVNFRYLGKMKCVPVHRIIYVWHFGEIPDGYEVIHADNDPNNNSFKNLTLYTPYETYNRSKLRAFMQYVSKLSRDPYKEGK